MLWAAPCCQAPWHGEGWPGRTGQGEPRLHAGSWGGGRSPPRAGAGGPGPFGLFFWAQTQMPHRGTRKGQSHPVLPVSAGPLNWCASTPCAQAPPPPPVVVPPNLPELAPGCFWPAALGGRQEQCGGLGCALPHHVDGLGVAAEAEGVAAGRGAEIDGHHHGEGGALQGARLAPLQHKEDVRDGARLARGEPKAVPAALGKGIKPPKRVNFSCFGPAVIYPSLTPRRGRDAVTPWFPLQ